MWGKLAALLSFLLIFSFSHFLILSCEGIDCTLNNVVTLNIGFYKSEDGAKASVADTLNIIAEGTDSVLLNRGLNLQSVSIPISYWQEADTLHMKFSGDEDGNTYEYDLVLRVAKSNMPHFESPDCPTTMFHEITKVDYDDPYHLTDSIVVENTAVNYASLENIKIYLRSSGD